MNALVNPSVRQIVAQVDVVLKHNLTANVIGIRAQGRGDWPAQVKVGERDFAVAWCPSPIAVREQLVALGALILAGGLPAQAWINWVGIASLWAAAALTAITGWDYLRVGIKHMD